MKYWIQSQAQRLYFIMGKFFQDIGIQQILTQAATQHLSITAEVADIRSYTTHKQYDVELIDRDLHMLSADERIPTLERYLGLVATSGFLLLMDTPANIKPFNQFLMKTDDWKTCLQTNNTLFTQKISQHTFTTVLTVFRRKKFYTRPSSTN